MSLSEILNIQYPVIVAPMFLVSNVKMVTEAMDYGATAAFPALNYRSDEELRQAISDIKKHSKKAFGVNLIVNQSNPKYKKQLDTLLEMKVPFIITSLGSPEETISRCKPLGIKVFCDVIDAKMAQKVAALGADAIIAVNNQAGGHCGHTDQASLIKSIKAVCDIPIISAGGIATPLHIEEALSAGAAGVSVGTIFLAAQEAQISDEYRQALIDYSAKDIVLTTKISGSHLTVINTPYVQQMGTKANFWEKLMLKNKTLKKYIKFIIYLKGMNTVKNAAKNNNNYKTVWCAGPAIEYIHAIRPMKEILKSLIGK